MARIRSIKPELPQSETIGRLSRDARLLFIQLFTLVDDEGRARAASRMLASLLYPYDDDVPELIEGWLVELEREGCIRRYEADGSIYLEVLNWLKHQKIDKPTKSRLPAYREDSANTRESSRGLAPDLGSRIMDQDMDRRSDTHPSGALGNAADLPEEISEEHRSPPFPSKEKVPQQSLLLEGELLPPRKPRKAARATRKVGWPSDLVFDQQHQRFAAERGFAPEVARQLWQRFENHHRAKGNSFVDWLAAWRTWVLNEVKFAGSRPARPMGNGQYPTESGFSPIVDSGLQTLNQINGEEF